YTLYIPGVFPAPDTLFPHTGLSGAPFEVSGHEGHDVQLHRFNSLCSDSQRPPGVPGLVIQRNTGRVA
ncbi:hypothetical protein SBW75_32045, partial [Pseudomonas aeruginosa]|nr:hypothetical protein [Pseudomonas aeruginosa]